MTKPRLSISFSGGRTSAVMTKLCLEKYSDSHDIAVVFANTGCEHEATYDFIRDCDEHFGFGTVWIEAIIGGKGVGPRAKVVDYDTASRNGEPFEAYIAKAGIPNSTTPACTARLKVDALNAFYRDHLGWKDYQTAIGIRADEADRMSSKAIEQNFVYPLVNEGWTKSMVNAEVASWPFDLQLPGDHFGNCVWCWKKSDRKLMTLAIESPEVFDFPRRMEEKYRYVKADSKASKDGERLFFRKYRRVDDIFEQAKRPFTPYKDDQQMQLFGGAVQEIDIGGSCGESCEIGADE
jgi:hypothetical protein